MVDQAVEKNDIDFLPKMDVLVKKEAISQETADAVKTLLDLKLQEQGTTVDEWMQNGAKERKAKINETRAKIQDLNTKMKEEKAQTPIQSQELEQLKVKSKEYNTQEDFLTALESKEGIVIEMTPKELYKYQDTRVMNSKIPDGDIVNSLKE